MSQTDRSGQIISALLSLSFIRDQEGRRIQSACPDVLSKMKWGYWSPASADEHQSQNPHKGIKHSPSVSRKQELKVYRDGKSRSSRENGFHKQSANPCPGTSVWLARQWENQKSYYLKRNIQRVFPAGILEKALGEIKCQSFLASSCFPEAKGKKDRGGGKKSMMFALLLIFALQNVFVCPGGKVSTGLSQNLCSWLC